mmetsp:Transcript_99694/g.266367  ORF Transcript_99694/g.266367 Transcript_99694/m.266367 type:complete len:204 (-) Transcript_99694:1849-2460(-)
MGLQRRSAWLQNPSSSSDTRLTATPPPQNRLASSPAGSGSCPQGPAQSAHFVSCFSGSASCPGDTLLVLSRLAVALFAHWTKKNHNTSPVANAPNTIQPGPRTMFSGSPPKPPRSMGSSILDLLVFASSGGPRSKGSQQTEENMAPAKQSTIKMVAADPRRSWGIGGRLPQVVISLYVSSWSFIFCVKATTSACSGLGLANSS